MANQKNQSISVPLSGSLNFSKIKTNVSQYNGFNDLNSPIYGDTLSPLYTADRNTKAPGNDRPYLDIFTVKDDEGKEEIKKILRNKDGEQLIDLSDYKGIKRKKLEELPANTLAVFDEEHYIAVNEDQDFTEIYMGKDETGTDIVKTVPYEAIAAAYSEKSQHLLFLAEKGFLHIYDSISLKELASAQSVDNVRAVIHTFYDPLNDWNVISMHEPFGSWDYHREAKKTTIDPHWYIWRTEKVRLETVLQNAKDAETSARDTYRSKKSNRDGLIADIDAKEKYIAGRDRVAADARESQYWHWFWLPDYFSYKRVADNAEADAARGRRELAELRTKLANWEKDNGGSLAGFKTIWDNKHMETYSAEQALKRHVAAEPPKYGNNPDNPDYFYGRIGPAFNFLFDSKTNKLVKKDLQIPWQSMNEYTIGPSKSSYIITGIYDTGFWSDNGGEKGFNNGTYIKNTEEDYIRYRLGVIPYEMGDELEWLKPGETPSPRPKDKAEYYFTLGYTPKIHFRKHDINEPWIISENIEAETKSYVCSQKVDTRQKGDNPIYQKTTSVDIYFAGTGEYGTNPVWGKVIFEPKEKNSAPSSVSKETYYDFNKWNAFHDFGGAPYTMYSPYLRDETGNCFNDDGIKKEILKGTINYDICSSYNFYEVPNNNGERIKLKPEAKNIFREVINNNAISNISIAEDKYSIGTNIETPNSVEGTTPIFYREGKDGGSVVYKTIYDEWIEVTVTDTIDDVEVINDEYVIVYTTAIANCIRLRDGKIKHWAPDWNNRFSLVGSTYPQSVQPIALPATSPVDLGQWLKGKIVIASAINPVFEASHDQICGYAASKNMICANSDNITFMGHVSKYDKIDIYFSDFFVSGVDTPKYYKSMDSTFINASLFGDTKLEGTTYPIRVMNIPGLFCYIKPSNFGRYYLEDGNIFYSLLIYNGQTYYTFDTTTGLDDIKELFMVQGQTFAITKGDYLYSVFLSQNGTANMSDAIVNIEGLQFCGSIPEMAIFYSPMDRTLKSFTADHILKDIQQATLIDKVYYTTYCPQTSSIYICTNNGIYVYSANNQYRLPIRGVEEIYFGGSENKHTYIVYKKSVFNEDGTENKVTYTKDFVFDRGYRESSDSFTSTDFGEDYKLQPILLETRFFGAGNNGITITDCVYFRLFSNIGPIDTTIKIKEKSITDGVYTKAEKELKISKDDWDEDTNTCYVRYQPKNQRSAGLSLGIESACAISEMVFSTSQVDTTASSKPKLSM